MRSANMSVVGRAVVKRFATRGTRESAFGSSLVVRFQVTSEVFLFPKLFLAEGTFVRFVPSMDALMGCKVIGASKCFLRRCRNHVPCEVFWRGVARHPFEHPTINYYQLVLV